MNSNIKPENLVQRKKERIQSWVLDKERLSTNFINETENVRIKKIIKGGVYFCQIGENIGEEQCSNRPVLVISKDFYNQHSSQVTVVPLSTTVKMRNKKVKGFWKRQLATRTHYLLKKHDFNFLDKDSVAKCEQIRSVSKVRLTRKIGEIDPITFERVQKRVKDLLDL